MRSLLFFIVLSLTISACQSQNTSDLSSPDTVKPEAVPTIDPANEQLYLAQQNYNKLCAHCHGWAGDGQPPLTIESTEQHGYHIVPRHNSTGHTWQHPDQILFEVIKYGVQAPTNLYPMSPFDEHFTDDEIFGIIEYIKQWWTDDQRRQQSTLTEQYTEINPFWEEDNLNNEES
jgi:mono/diheme cytochrome c family protein